MASALDLFRTMMREQVGPELRRMGFKGSGQSFSIPSDRHWVVLGFQKSRTSSSDSVGFTVNVTVASKSAWAEARSDVSYLPVRPSANTRYGPPAWQERIGRLLPDRQDRWWTLTRNSSTTPMAADVVRAIRDYAMPAIRQQLEAS